MTIKNNLSIPHRKRPKRRIYLWNKSDPIKIRTEASKFSLDFLNTVDLDVDDMLTSFNNKLLEFINNCVPSKGSSSGYFPPWITPHTKRYIRNKQLWYQRAKRKKMNIIPGRNMKNTKLVQTGSPMTTTSMTLSSPMAGTTIVILASDTGDT